jgi:hypothetical protein
LGIQSIGGKEARTGAQRDAKPRGRIRVGHTRDVGPFRAWLQSTLRPHPRFVSSRQSHRLVLLMASGVKSDSFDVDGHPSSPIGSSDSELAVNTATSRVYFGPVQSPERRHIRAQRASQPTPIRRFGNHTAGSPAVPLRILQSDEEGASSSNEILASDQSRADTPNVVDDALEGMSYSTIALYSLRCAFQNPHLH